MEVVPANAKLLGLLSFYFSVGILVVVNLWDIGWVFS